MGLTIHAWAQSDRGRLRTTNEDGFLADTGLGLYVVCDGMGGAAAGETASAEALEEIHRRLSERREALDGLPAEPSVEERQAVRALLDEAVQAASSHVFSLAVARPQLRGMGTTISLLLAQGSRAYLAHVGDSRIYLVRAGQVHQLTEDHTVQAELVRRNRVDPEALRRLPFKHSLSRAVGTQATVEVDTVDLEIVAGDRFVICSDGLTEYLPTTSQLAELLDAGPLAEGPQRLVDHANGGGGRDNITAMVLEARLPEASAEELGTELAQHQFRMDTLGAIGLFRHLSYKELIQVFNITESRHYPPGATIVRQGDPASSLFIVLRGQARVLEGPQPVRPLGRGDHFGELALIDRGPRTATVEALSAVQVRLLEREPLYELLRGDPALASKVLWNFVQALAVRLRESSSTVVQLREQLAELGERAAPSPREAGA